MTGRTAETILGRGETTAEEKRRPLGPSKLRVARLDRAVCGVTLHAGMQPLLGRGPRRQCDRRLGIPGLGRFRVIQPRPVASLAADSAVLPFRSLRARSIRYDRAKPRRVTGQAMRERLSAQADADVVTGIARARNRSPWFGPSPRRGRSTRLEALARCPLHPWRAS